MLHRMFEAHAVLSSAYQDMQIRPATADVSVGTARFEEIAEVCWALHGQQYFDAHKAGMAWRSLRYNELVSHREESVRRVFKSCGLAGDGIAEALRAFDEDSHAGSQTAHDTPVQKLTSGAHARIAEVLAFYGTDGRQMMPDDIMADMV